MEKTRKHLQDGLLCDNLLYKETVWGGQFKAKVSIFTLYGSSWLGFGKPGKKLFP